MGIRSSYIPTLYHALTPPHSPSFLLPLLWSPPSSPLRLPSPFVFFLSFLPSSLPPFFFFFLSFSSPSLYPFLILPSSPLPLFSSLFSFHTLPLIPLPLAFPHSSLFLLSLPFPHPFLTIQFFFLPLFSFPPPLSLSFPRSFFPFFPLFPSFSYLPSPPPPSPASHHDPSPFLSLHLLPPQ